MSNYEITEERLVITEKGKMSGDWTWLHLGGWAKGLKNPTVDRFASSEQISGSNMIATQAELDEALFDGLFERKVVTRVVSCV